MPAEIPTLQDWNKLSLDDCKALGRNLYPPLPRAFHFDGVETVKAGEQQRNVIYYECSGSRFALIPGGKAVLGYDRKKPFKPTPAQKKSWAKNVRNTGIKYALAEYLDENLSPLRTVQVKPFLFEVRPSRLGLMPVPKRKEKEPLPPEEYYASTAGFKGFRQMKVTLELAALTAATSGEGLRLPTSDEWEYACGGGARTLFHWGDDCPTDCYPIDENQPFKLHTQPNALGVQMPSNPFALEWTSTPGLLRGGDGGGTLCGDADWFVGWLPLATAFVYRENEALISGGNLRRAFSIA